MKLEIKILLFISVVCLLSYSFVSISSVNEASNELYKASNESLKHLEKITKVKVTQGNYRNSFKKADIDESKKIRLLGSFDNQSGIYHD